MRALIDLYDAQVQALAALCERTNQPRAAIIREAVDEYLARHRTPASLNDAFGLWGRADEDGVAYQDKVRAEW